MGATTGVTGTALATPRDGAGGGEPGGTAGRAGTGSRPRLRGRRLLLARAAYGVLLLLVLGLVAGGMPAWYRTLASGDVGIHLTHDGAGQTVVSPVAGSPAAQAGLREGDVLVAIDGVPVPQGRPWTSWSEGARRLAGLPGTPVVLDVRTADGATRQYALTREARAAAQAGLSPAAYALYRTALDVVLLLGFVAPALLIFSRRSDDWLGIFVSLVLVVTAAENTDALPALAMLHPQWAGAWVVLSVTYKVAVLALLYVFPDGRFVPRWTRHLLVAGVGWALLYQFVRHHPVSTLLDLALYATGLFAQLYRYRHASSPQERQQTKWVVFGMAVAFVGVYVYALAVSAVVTSQAAPTPATVRSQLIGQSLASLALLAVPLAFTVSILRYRLYDIDLLINRALVYVPLTGVVAGVVAASSTLSQKVFLAATAQESVAATVLATLVAVAALTPVKDRLQAVVDRYFKEVPDPRKELRAWSEQVGSRVFAVDELQLSRQFLEQAVRAFGAQSGAVYLASVGGPHPAHAARHWTGEAVLSAPLQSGPGAARLGVISLGPRRRGQEYTARDCEVLQAAAQVVAVAIEEDRQLEGNLPARSP